MEITRRNFLSGAAFAGVAAAAGLAGCSPSNNSSSSSDSSSASTKDEAVKHNPSKSEEFDVVVAGSGTAGTCAALRAAQQGAKVVCIEKNSSLMGTSSFAEGFAGVGSKFQAEQGITVDPVKVVEDTLDYHHCGCLAPVVRKMIYSSGETIDWLADNGVKFASVASLGNSYPVWHLPADETGAATHVSTVLETLKPVAEKAGVEFRTECPMTGLVVENGKVTGVYAKQSGSEIQINAKAVILATGGWANNAEMFETLTAKSFDSIRVWGMEGRDGDGINYAVNEAGAATHHPEAIMWHTGALDQTDAFSDPENYILLMQPTLHVNENAQRYFNEAFTSDFTSCGNALTSQGKNFVIIDDAYIDHVEKEGPWMPMPNLGAFAGQPYECRSSIENAKGLVKANTIEELAEKLGLDKTALKETIDQYNGYCAAGVDEEYGKAANMLLPVSTAPFYGGKVTPTMFTTVGGLKVNTNMQVVKEAGDVIEGLYAVGGDANGMYGANYDVDVMSGGQQGWCATSGKLAAEHACANL